MENENSYDIWNRGNTTNHSSLRRRKQSDNLNNGLELTPDEQNERMNLFLLGFAIIILMNAMTVLIIVFVKISKYPDQLVIKSNNMKKQKKGK